MTFNQTSTRKPPLVTPDGRYIIVRGRLWRRHNPALKPEIIQQLVNTLMNARRAVASARRANDIEAEEQAHATVDGIKRALGERGPVWWLDGTSDLTRTMVHNSPYAQWFLKIEAAAE